MRNVIEAEERCVLCELVQGAPAIEDILLLEEGCYAFVPAQRVLYGHWVVVPWEHVGNAEENADVTSRLYRQAARLAAAMECNVVTVPPAESARHMHVHLVPRHPDDPVRLAWTP